MEYNIKTDLTFDVDPECIYRCHHLFRSISPGRDVMDAKVFQISHQLDKFCIFVVITESKQEVVHDVENATGKIILNL